MYKNGVINLLKEFEKKYNLYPSDYMVISTASLVLQDVMESCDDIDIVIFDSGKDLEERDIFKENFHHDNSSKDLYKSNDIDGIYHLSFGVKDFESCISYEDADNAVEIDNHCFFVQSIEDVLIMKAIQIRDAEKEYGTEPYKLHYKTIRNFEIMKAIIDKLERKECGLK